MSLAEYDRRLEAATVAFLDDKMYVPAEYHPEHNDRLTATGTFRLAIDKARRRHTAAEPLIVYCALLAPEPIPLFLFSEARGKFGEPLASALAGDGLDKAIAALRSVALVDRESHGGSPAKPFASPETGQEGSRMSRRRALPTRESSRCARRRRGIGRFAKDLPQQGFPRVEQALYGR